MREIFKNLFGNDSLKSVVGSAIENGRASHAYIFEGPDGSGKLTAARLAAASLSCINRRNDRFPLPCGQCPVCHRILSGISTDVITISRDERATIGVGQIRLIRSDLYSAPNDSDHKVYIISEADKMTPQAQNALLISLEEPPPFVTFFLLSEDKEKLLETVRSRAVTVRMELFGEEAIEEYLKSDPDTALSAKRSPEKLKKAASMCGGSIGAAKKLLSESSSKLNSDSGKAESLAFMLVAGKTGDAIVLASGVSSAGLESVGNLLVGVASDVRMMIELKKNVITGSPDGFTDEDRSLLAGIPVSRLIFVFEQVKEALERIKTNVSPKNVLYDLVFSCRRQ